MAMTRYCLDCGYSRQGLPEDAVCPECGEADSFDKQREVCAALAGKPLALLWRVMTLRRMPKGWWVVFEDKRPARLKPLLIFLIGILALLTYNYLGKYVNIKTETITFFYATNDPQKSMIQVVSKQTDYHYLMTYHNYSETTYAQGYAQIIGSSNTTINTGKMRSTQLIFDPNLPGSNPTLLVTRKLLIFAIVAWLLSRFLWLPLIARDHKSSALRSAAEHTTVIYLAHVLWMIAISLVGFLLILITSHLSEIDLKWIRDPYNLLQFVATIFCPTVLWWRFISTDNLKLEFPRRFSAGLLLIGFTVLAAFGVFTWPWFWFW